MLFVEDSGTVSKWSWFSKDSRLFDGSLCDTIAR